jgi:hypothetical protein
MLMPPRAGRRSVPGSRAGRQAAKVPMYSYTVVIPGLPCRRVSGVFIAFLVPYRDIGIAYGCVHAG